MALFFFIEAEKREADHQVCFSFFWRRHPDLNRGIADLQSAALPLGYGANKIYGTCPYINLWSGLRGSNSLPPPWQGGALPDELKPHVVPQARVELATRGFSVRCSTN